MTGRTVAPPPVPTPSPGPVPTPSSTLLDDLRAALDGAADGLSDAEVRAALADRHPGLKTQKVNLLCRRLCVAGEVERVGTRPIRNRLRQAPATPEVELVARPRAEDAVVAPDPAPAGAPALPVHDPDLAWSRGVNVAASVALWLVRRGAAVRAAPAAGATGRAAPHSHELVVRLDGTEVHVEVTGWPPRAPHRQRTDAAAEWFSAATTAALVRARAHPGARVVVALPDTRRYRTLAARAPDPGHGPVTVPEVWFVDDRGAVRPLARFAPLLPG